MIEELVKHPNASLVDVRTVEEFEETSVPGSINIPLHTVPLNLDRFKELPQPIVVYCRSGARSYQAVSWLRHQGVESHDGGGIEWILSLRD